MMAHKKNLKKIALMNVKKPLKQSQMLIDIFITKKLKYLTSEKYILH